ncbi:MAG TPA: hypothetical protein VFE42_22790 [Chloroflexota bacterium]|nr:hypothetical protein [Chloroflexota bacterium]
MPEMAGVRFDPYGPLVFCRCEVAGVAAGCEVLVMLADGERSGVVEVPPDRIFATELPRAPRIVAVRQPARDDSEPVAIPDGIDFLTAADGDVGTADLAEALRLAALPVPAPPEQRRP